MLSKMSTDFNDKVSYKGQPAMSLSVKKTMKVACLLHKVDLRGFVLEESGMLVYLSEHLTTPRISLRSILYYFLHFGE